MYVSLFWPRSWTSTHRWKSTPSLRFDHRAFDLQIASADWEVDSISVELPRFLRETDHRDRLRASNLAAYPDLATRRKLNRRWAGGNFLRFARVLESSWHPTSFSCQRSVRWCTAARNAGLCSLFSRKSWFDGTGRAWNGGRAALLQK